jgi:hypothetical protein
VPFCAVLLGGLVRPFSAARTVSTLLCWLAIAAALVLAAALVVVMAEGRSPSDAVTLPWVALFVAVPLFASIALLFVWRRPKQ